MSRSTAGATVAQPLTSAALSLQMNRPWADQPCWGVRTSLISLLLTPGGRRCAGVGWLAQESYWMAGEVLCSLSRTTNDAELRALSKDKKEGHIRAGTDDGQHRWSLVTHLSSQPLVWHGCLEARHGQRKVDKHSASYQTELHASAVRRGISVWGCVSSRAPATALCVPAARVHLPLLFLLLLQLPHVPSLKCKPRLLWKLLLPPS
jgi:hypothetical protein